MSYIPNSPTLPTDSGIVYTNKQFSDNLTLDLTDSEIQQAIQIITSIKKKWQQRFLYKFNDMSAYSSVARAAEDAAKLIDEFEKELHETMRERMDIAMQVDMAPVFEGEAPIIELIGHLASHSSAKYGLDHERKEKEVKRAKELGEAYLGEKYEPNPESKRQKSLKAEQKRRQDFKKD